MSAVANGPAAGHYGSRLALIKHQFAAIPHWPHSPTKPAAPTFTPSAAEVRDFQRQQQQPTADEYAEGLADSDYSLDGVFSLFKMKQATRVAQGEKQLVTASALEKNIRNALPYFKREGGEKITRRGLRESDIDAAKSRVLSAVASRRTAKNYLADVRKMLTWFYDSEYGAGFQRPTGFATVFNVRQATRTDVDIYSAAQLRELLCGTKERSGV